MRIDSPYIEPIWYSWVRIFFDVLFAYGHLILYILILASAISYLIKEDKTAAWLGIIAFLIFTVKILMSYLFGISYCDPAIYFC